MKVQIVIHPFILWLLIGTNWKNLMIFTIWFCRFWWLKLRFLKKASGTHNSKTIHTLFCEILWNSIWVCKYIWCERQFFASIACFHFCSSRWHWCFSMDYFDDYGFCNSILLWTMATFFLGGDLWFLYMVDFVRFLVAYHG